MHKGEDEVYAAFVGIDWADKKHDVCLQVAGSAKRERLVLEHRSGVIQAWAEQLRERFGGAPVAVSVELSREGANVSVPGSQSSRERLGARRANISGPTSVSVRTPRRIALATANSRNL